MKESSFERWWVFTCERFPLVSHLLMISLFVTAHLMIFFLEGGEVPALRGFRCGQQLRLPAHRQW